MSAPIRRTLQPITDAVYPRTRKKDHSTPEERLAEHLESVRPDKSTFTFRIARAHTVELAALISYQGGKPTWRGSKKRRPRRRSKTVTA